MDALDFSFCLKKCKLQAEQLHTVQYMKKCNTYTAPECEECMVEFNAICVVSEGGTIEDVPVVDGSWD